MNSISLCRGWLWSVKRIKGPLARVDEAVSLFLKRLPGRPSSFSTAAAPRGSTRPKHGTSSRQSRTGTRHSLFNCTGWKGKTGRNPGLLPGTWTNVVCSTRGVSFQRVCLQRNSEHCWYNETGPPLLEMPRWTYRYRFWVRFVERVSNLCIYFCLNLHLFIYLFFSLNLERLQRFLVRISWAATRLRDGGIVFQRNAGIYFCLTGECKDIGRNKISK